MRRKRKPQAAKIRGIYRRGNIFWYARMQEGRQVEVSLETDDFVEALQRAIEVRAKPFLETSEPLEKETEGFISHKGARNEYSKNSAGTKQIQAPNNQTDADISPKRQKGANGSA